MARSFARVRPIRMRASRRWIKFARVGMKHFLALLFFLFLSGEMATAAPARNLDVIPGARESLLRMVGPKFYRSLLMSPVEDWIVVRGNLVDNHLRGTKVVHSELKGAYDSLALELAKNLIVLDYTSVQTAPHARPVLVYLLIYQIADARLAISFAHFDEVGSTQLRYSGAAWMAAQKPNAPWITIEPKRLAPGERRGPRTYWVAVESPGDPVGNGRPPIASFQIQASPNTVTHTARER